MKEKKTRKHNQNWQDNTKQARIANRREKLKQIAQAAGYANWSAYETAVLNGLVHISRPPKIA